MSFLTSKWRSRRIKGLTSLLIPLLLLGVATTVAFSPPAQKPAQASMPSTDSLTIERQLRSIQATTSSTTTSTTTAPKPVVKQTIPTTPTLVIPTDDIWNQLAECESSQDWSYNGSSGFDGGLQFSPATWTRMHTHWGMNTGYEFAWQAPREVQIEVAIRLMQVSSGTHSQWPVCSRKIGMPNKF